MKKKYSNLVTSCCGAVLMISTVGLLVYGTATGKDLIPITQAPIWFTAASALLVVKRNRKEKGINQFLK